MASNPNEHVCIIHPKTVKTEPDSPLISPESYDSWLTLLEAAKVRNFTPVLDVAENLNECKVPLIYYHRKCRSLFTMKRELETLKRKIHKPDDEDNEDSKQITAKKRNVASSSRVPYSDDCIFCGKVKYVRSTSSRETLVKAAQLRVDKTLREKALIKCDENILAVTSRDVVAAEAYYHRSCYRDYTRPEK